MSTTKKDPNDAVKMTSGLDDQMQADLDEVMRKYDRESNTRVWEGWQRWVVGILMVAFSLYCIGMTLFFGICGDAAVGRHSLLVIFLLVYKDGLLGFNYGNCPFRNSLDFDSVYPRFRKYRFLFLYAERRRLPHEGRRRRSVRKNMQH